MTAPQTAADLSDTILQLLSLVPEAEEPLIGKLKELHDRTFFQNLTKEEIFKETSTYLQSEEDWSNEFLRIVSGNDIPELPCDSDQLVIKYVVTRGLPKDFKVLSPPDATYCAFWRVPWNPRLGVIWSVGNTAQEALNALVPLVARYLCDCQVKELIEGEIVTDLNKVLLESSWSDVNHSE